ncbi:MAG: HEAT repeat domain-containing protein [Kiritimatiellia bacterium]
MQLPRLLCRLAALLACTAVLAQAPGKFDDPPAAFTLDQALAAVGRYQPGDSRQPVNALDREVMQATATPAARAAMSARLAALLADPASTPMCRKLVCHQWLPLVAGDEALPVLKAMLATAGQEQTALDALARLPGEAAAATLRGALASPEPKVRDMAAELCGFRGDAAAVPALIAMAGQSPAAVRALARIGTPEAVKFLTDKSDWSDPSDRVFALATAGIEQPLLPADQPRNHRIAGLAAAARSADGVATLSAALQDADEAVAATAVVLLETSTDPKATAALMGALKAASPGRQANLLEALANRGDAAALPAIAPLVSGTNMPARIAALRAIGQLGGPDAVAALVPVALSDDVEAAAAARDSLVRLRGDAAAAALRAGASAGDAKSRASSFPAGVAGRPRRSRSPVPGRG